jgi:phytoene desaturase
MLTHALPAHAGVLPQATTGRSGPRPHAVVIGSGFGGLAAAVRLGARGWRVTVLEKLDAPGGRAYVHKIDGFTFDAGPTVITAPWLLEELWTLAGKRLADEVPLKPVDPFYRVRFDNGDEFNYRGDAAAMRAEVARFAPGDVAGYERFLEHSEKVYRVGFEQLGHVPFSNFSDMVRVLPKLMQLEGWRTVWQMACKHVADPRLRMVLTFQTLLVGGSPFATTSVYCLVAFLERRYGVHWAMGGTGKLIEGLAGLVAHQGNAVRYETGVKQILVKDGTACGVELDNGERIAADAVVSNADSATTYRSLIAPQHRKRWTDARIERAQYSMGLFVWYFGTKRQYPDVAHHTISLGPRYRGLIDNIFKDKKLAEDFSLYLHRPTASDASMAPPGCDTFYALVPVPHLDSGTDWTKEAEPYRQRVMKKLSATLLPGLENEIVASRVTTPLDFQNRLSSYKGAGFGMAPVLTQSAWFRPHNESEDVKRLYIVGAGTHPGAGVPGVLTSARILDTVVPHGDQIISTARA